MEILGFLSDTAMMNLTLSELMCALAALAWSCAYMGASSTHRPSCRAQC